MKVQELVSEQPNDEAPKLGQIMVQLNNMDSNIKRLCEVQSELSKQLHLVSTGLLTQVKQESEDPGELVPMAKMLFEFNTSLDSLIEGVMFTIRNLEL